MRELVLTIILFPSNLSCHLPNETKQYCIPDTERSSLLHISNSLHMSWNTVGKAWKGCVSVCCSIRAHFADGVQLLHQGWNKKCETILTEPYFTAFDTIKSQLYFWFWARSYNIILHENLTANLVYFVTHCLRVKVCSALRIILLLITQLCNIYISIYIYIYIPLATQIIINYV